MTRTSFRRGVVEGFYGRPWSDSQRLRLFDRMRKLGLNQYLYAPKDDVKHRACWRQRYDSDEMATLTRLIAEAQRHGVTFIYGIGPGLDLRFSSRKDAATLRRKLEQLQTAGCRSFALMFDDLPLTLHGDDQRRFRTPARAQAEIANQMRRTVASNGEWLFCPTIYCGRMAGGNVLESEYLKELGTLLHPSIDVFWTGPEIISEEITVAGIRALRKTLGRKPILWDNLHANDYDYRRIYVGPYAGRPPALRQELAGILINPNCEFEANHIPLCTLAAYLKTRSSWQPRRAYRSAIRSWLPQWKTHGARRITLADLERLGDCLYLPHMHGDHARRWLADFRIIRNQPPSSWGRSEQRFLEGCRQFERLYDILTTLKDRELLHTFYRFLWDLKEESILLQRYVHWRKAHPQPHARFVSGDHRPGIYRGGVIAELQRLLPMAVDSHELSNIEI